MVEQKVVRPVSRARPGAHLIGEVLTGLTAAEPKSTQNFAGRPGVWVAVARFIRRHAAPETP